MRPQQVNIVQRTWEQISPNANEVAAMFYARLFELDPSLRSLFPADLQPQNRKLVNAFNMVVRNLRNLERLEPLLHELGRRHAGYGVEDRHYSTVGAALLDTLEAGLRDGFTAAVREAWTATYGIVAKAMKSGATHDGSIMLAI